jgi:hypothetical protein
MVKNHPNQIISHLYHVGFAYVIIPELILLIVMVTKIGNQYSLRICCTIDTGNTMKKTYIILLSGNVRSNEGVRQATNKISNVCCDRFVFFVHNNFFCGPALYPFR